MLTTLNRDAKTRPLAGGGGTSMRLVAMVGLTFAGVMLAGCRDEAPLAYGDPARGALVIGQEQCGSCHQIPGVPAAKGIAGPPLQGFRRRTMIAGLIANTPSNLVAWLRSPQTVAPGNAMPDMGLSRRQAGDVAAYLEGLQ